MFNIESLMPFVPVLLIIGIRIFMERKKRAAAQQALASMLDETADPEPYTAPQKWLSRGEQSDPSGEVLVAVPKPAKAPLKDMPVPGKEKKRGVHLAYLPPLKRGVVWAEILGPPKGL
ncbi:MAG: hypothetical protein LBT13_07800 [Treponema sp.]|nr:hypothetical protein [Treponema sp.]